jgi:hypothetical protein
MWHDCVELADGTVYQWATNFDHEIEIECWIPRDYSGVPDDRLRCLDGKELSWSEAGSSTHTEFTYDSGSNTTTFKLFRDTWEGDVLLDQWTEPMHPVQHFEYPGIIINDDGSVYNIKQRRIIQHIKPPTVAQPAKSVTYYSAK